MNLRIHRPILAAFAVVLAGCGSEPRAKPDIKTDSSKSLRIEHRKSGSELTPTVDRDDEPQFETVPPKKVVIRPAGGEPQPEPVFRPSDDRPKHDAALARRGIHRYASKRLILYTDVDPKIARTLPPLLDQAYAAWEAYFGKLPPNRERTPFQVTGYLIKDKARFEAAKLIPLDLPKFVNGRHRGYQFWMYDPPWDYYRRHLLIHEATHCFMYATREPAFPTWYMEGMAEFFATHDIEAGGRRSDIGGRKNDRNLPTSDLRSPTSATVSA